MRYFLGLALVTLLMFSCRKKLTNELLETPKTVYTIKGVLYDEDGTTPIPNKRLVLSVNGGFSLTGYGDDIGYTQVITTDQSGRYNFNYPTLDIKVEATLTINPHHDDLPAVGSLLKDIPLHQNIERDICMKPFSRLNITFDLPINNATDTFYFYTPIFVDVADTFERINGFKTLILHDKSKNIMEFSGNGNDSPNSYEHAYQWYIIANTKEEFRDLSEKKNTSNSPNFVQNKVILRFPETTEWTVTYTPN